jgi:hypothetical protein
MRNPTRNRLEGRPGDAAGPLIYFVSPLDAGQRAAYARPRVLYMRVGICVSALADTHAALRRCSAVLTDPAQRYRSIVSPRFLGFSVGLTLGI